jgi:exodeoxyribonuclease VII large subunit
MAKRIYSVSELTRNIRVVLEDTFPEVWIEGEVSNFTRHSSGHMYFTLKDEASQLACVVFRSVNQKIKFALSDGMQLICFGRISVYDRRGAYQLYVEQVEPKGVGALQLAFEQLKEKLAKEGLFDEERKRPIPYLPTRIGVVTSPTGAAIRDILEVTRRRFSNIEIVINPVKVQGKGAAGEIAHAIKEFNKLATSLFAPRGIDVLIIGRGGGSLEDLWAFNEEVVARAICASRIPVISAVGHEIDYTIADLVADLRAPTPSAAAELVTPRKEELEERIVVMAEQLRSLLLNKIGLWREKLTALQESYVLREPLNLFRQAKQRLDEFERSLRRHTCVLLDAKKQALGFFIGKLEALSPLAVLERGYSITMNLPKGSIVKDAQALRKGDTIKSRLARGALISTIERVEP